MSVSYLDFKNPTLEILRWYFHVVASGSQTHPISSLSISQISSAACYTAVDGITNSTVFDFHPQLILRSVRKRRDSRSATTSTILAWDATPTWFRFVVHCEAAWNRMVLGVRTESLSDALLIFSSPTRKTCESFSLT